MWSAKRILAACMALALTAGMVGCTAETTEEKETILTGVAAQKTKTYETYEMVEGDIEKTGTLSLTPIYSQTQSLCAPANDLILDRIYVERKQRVAEGEVIATFTQHSSEARLAAAELALSRAQESLTAQLETLQETIDEAAEKKDTELGEVKLELAQLAYDRAAYIGERQVKQLQATVDAEKAKFETVELKAPFDCIVDSVAYLYDKQEVDTKTAVAEISRLSSMVLVGETSTNNFQYGNDIRVEYGKKDTRVSIPAHVVSTSTLLGQDGQKVWMVMDEPVEKDDLQKPTAKVDIIQIRNALTVPRTAIQAENGSSYVQILVDGVAHKRYIIRGIAVGTAGEGHVVVLSGLEPGQNVILN